MILFSLLHIFFAAAGQSNRSVTALLKSDQSKFLHQLNAVSIDSNIVHPLSLHFRSQTDSIQASITADGLLAAEKEKATKSLIYFINQLGENIAQQKIDMYDIPGALISYKNILQAILHHKPFEELEKPFDPRRSQLLATAFREYKEYALMDDIAVYKRLASTPEFILSYLEKKPGFRYADSLVMTLAANDPMKMMSYFGQSKSVLRENIRKTDNIYLQQIVLLSVDKNASELLPFITQLAEGRITSDTIIKARLDVVKYFQLLVNTLKESKASGDPSFVFEKILRDGLKNKSMSFYVNYINEQHSATDAKRFVAVKDLRPEDIYYIITSCEKELYTSSYLGLYKRLMEYFKTIPADSLFDIVHYDNFRIFMRMAANYNTLTDFLSKMSWEKAVAVSRRFISGIETDINSGLEKAMDIADSFTGLDSAARISELIRQELRSNLDRCQSQHLYFGVRLYNILLQVFGLVKQKGSLNELWPALGNYEVLKRNALQNKNGEIIQLVLFYGDEDGAASFNSFQKLFTDTSKWRIYKNTSWITVRSQTDEPIIIYANMPLDNKEEMDLKAQDSLVTFLEQQSLKPVILIHRGHSYHVDNTLKKLTPSVKLAILGSCGGYNNAISIASINPDAQIIVSKKTGSMSVNDPVIDVINETLLDKKDLSWPEIWQKLTARFSKDEPALNIFNEYIPPGKNVSLFVLKLFNSYNRPA